MLSLFLKFVLDKGYTLKQGIEQGVTQGEQLLLIGQIKQKIEKGLSDEVIIEHLELGMEKDRELLRFCKSNPTLSAKEVRQHIYENRK